MVVKAAAGRLIRARPLRMRLSVLVLVSPTQSLDREGCRGPGGPLAAGRCSTRSLQGVPELACQTNCDDSAQPFLA